MEITMRLQKAISMSGHCSRRAAEQLIEQGLVTVNGKVVRELGTKINAFTDKIKVEGKPITIQQEKLYFLLNKPRSVVCTKKDPEGRKTVMDFIPPGVRVNPVGRLDYDSEGIILLTNDGELMERILHPRYGVSKRYLVKVKGTPSPETLEKLRRGVTLEDGKAKFEKIRILESKLNRTWLEVEVKEGRNRFIRRMFLRVNHYVDRLRRVAIGPIEMGELPFTKWRHLTNRELNSLRKACGLTPE